MGKTHNKVNTEKIKDLVIDWTFIVFGVILIAISINFFFLPNKISSGGASGIATIFYYFLQIPMGLTTILLNIPLFVISIWKLGLRFSIKTIIATSLLSLLLEIIKVENFIQAYNLGYDLFIAAIFGGLVLGIGLSLVFKGNGSTGGSDLLANIIYKMKPSLNLSTILLIIDTLIIVATIIVFKSINIGLYSIIAIYISNKVIDLLFEGINYSKAFYIITNKVEEITKEIMNDLERGSTTIECIGTYTNNKYMMVISIVPKNQLSKVKQIIHKYDTNAFVYISNAHEVLGEGFKEFNKKK